MGNNVSSPIEKEDDRENDCVHGELINLSTAVFGIKLILLIMFPTLLLDLVVQFIKQEWE